MTITSNLIQDDNGQTIVAGDTINWKDDSGNRTGKVIADSTYEGGLRIGGRSLKAIWENSNTMEVVN